MKMKESENTRQRLPRKDIFLVSPKDLMLEEGFNTRTDYGNLEELKNSIIENGVKIPLRGYKEGDKYVINDGHRRYKAVMMAIEEGNEIVRVPFISEKKKTLEERIFEILISNDGKALTSLELGETYKKLQGFGFIPSEIAKKIGKSVSHVIDMINVAGSSKEVKDAIKEGNISATLVREVQNSVETAEEAEEIITTVVETKKEMGEKKVTKKDLDGLLPEKPKKEKKEKVEDLDREPLHIPEKKKPAIIVREYNNDKPFTEEEVVNLLQRQVKACADSIPPVFRKKVLDTPLVI